MRALVQRVLTASVTVDEETTGAIGSGLCVLVGVSHEDDESIAKKLAAKLWQLRLFEDDDGTMNLSAAELNKPLLIISQFTLYGDTRKGRRPSWIGAAPPEHAEPLIDAVVSELRSMGATVETGRFRSHMQVHLINDGPVTVSVEV